MVGPAVNARSSAIRARFAAAPSDGVRAATRCASTATSNAWSMRFEPNSVSASLASPRACDSSAFVVARCSLRLAWLRWLMAKPVATSAATTTMTNADTRTTCEAPGAAVLADVFAFEVVFGDAVHRRREIRDRGTESAVAQIEIGLVVRPPQIEMARFLGDCRREPFRYRVAHQATGVGVPGPLTTRQRGQDPIRGLRLQPVRELPIDPRRCGRFGRCEQHEPLRFVERGDNRRPQVWVGRQAGLVTEYPQRAHAVPRLRQPLQPRLQRGRQATVRGVAVRNERVVGQPCLPLAKPAPVAGLR